MPLRKKQAKGGGREGTREYECSSAASQQAAEREKERSGCESLCDGDDDKAQQ